MRKTIFLMMILLSFSSFSSICKGHFVNPITDVCWDCLFPLTIGNSNAVKGSYPDTENPKDYICTCTNNNIPRIGLSIGYWEPFALVDVTRKPFCMVNLGVDLGFGTKGLGGSQSPSEDGYGAFYYVHL